MENILNLTLKLLNKMPNSFKFKFILCSMYYGFR